jgi:hypothetical protein
VVLKVMAPCSLVGKHKCSERIHYPIFRVEVSNVGKIAGYAEVGKQEILLLNFSCYLPLIKTGLRSL